MPVCTIYVKKVHRVKVMKRERQQKILGIIRTRRVATQQELADALARSGLAATQSSVSRDIVELGLTKINGYYAHPQRLLPPDGPVVDVDTAGDNLIVVKTLVGQAQPAALAIDGARVRDIVGTVAGDDTIMVAVKDAAAQRAALKHIVKLFSRNRTHLPSPRRRRARSRSAVRPR
jgi:transcriptional regulator of arginine metabolism